MKTYLNHAALNLGAALANLWYGALPPQCTGHTDEDLRTLAESNPWREFLIGLGVRGRTDADR